MIGFKDKERDKEPFRNNPHSRKGNERDRTSFLLFSLNIF